MRRAEAKRISTLALVTAGLCLLLAVALLLPPVASVFGVRSAGNRAPQPTGLQTPSGQQTDTADRPVGIDRVEAINSLVRLGPPPRPRITTLPTTPAVTPATATETPDPDEVQTVEEGWAYLGQIRARRSYAVLAFEGRQVLVRQGDRIPDPPASPATSTTSASTTPTGRPGLPGTSPRPTPRQSTPLRGTLLEVHDSHVIIDSSGSRRRIDLAEMQVALGQVATPVPAGRNTTPVVTDRSGMTARGSAERSAQQNPLAARSMSGGLNPIERDRLLRGLQDGSVRPEDRPEMVQDPLIAEYLREKDPETYRYLFEKGQDAKSNGSGLQSGDVKLQGDRGDPVNRPRQLEDPKKQSRILIPVEDADRTNLEQRHARFMQQGIIT